MGFLFPLFLFALIALAIPVLIHLFNLRRYKKVNFPDTQFLRDIQLSTKRQAKIQDWKLLITRCVLLTVLILGFAQPYWGKKEDAAGKNAVNVLYIDNSYSMTVAEGQENLLQRAKAKARDLVASAPANARFLILANDRNTAMRPTLRNEALQAINELQPTAKRNDFRQIMAGITAAQEHESNERWNLYFFTDLQKASFQAAKDIPRPSNAEYYFYPLSAGKTSNLYVDTAYFLSPVLDPRQPNPLVVRSKQSGTATPATANLSVSVGEQVRAVKALEFNKSNVRLDTLEIQLSGNGWQPLRIALQDYPLSFDDTFRIAVRTAPELSVLVVADQPINPYLQAAFRTYDGFRVNTISTGNAQVAGWQTHSLIILQNIQTITPGLQQQVKQALDRGQNILLFPGNIASLEQFNRALGSWTGLRFEGPDTSRQQVVSMQEAHILLQDLFEKIPDNVQLPTVTRRYLITAGLSANQQSLLSFRDGKPFLAQYSPGIGKLYICATPLDDRSSNFPVSYFFAPIIYKMAIQSGGSNTYALQVGSNIPLWLPATRTDSRHVWSMRTQGFNAIPSQRAAGAGMEIFAGTAAKEAGFYYLQYGDNSDSVLVALNTAAQESTLEYATEGDVEQLLGDTKINWLNETSVKLHGWQQSGTAFPLWKVCIGLALLALGLETFLVWKKANKKIAVGA